MYKAGLDGIVHHCAPGQKCLINVATRNSNDRQSERERKKRSFLSDLFALKLDGVTIMMIMMDVDWLFFRHSAACDVIYNVVLCLNIRFRIIWTDILG